MSDLLAWIVNIGAITQVILSFYKYWIFSKGAKYLKKVYILTIVTGSLNLLVNSFLIIKDPEIWGLLSYQIVIVWSIIMSIKGLMGYKGENEWQ